MINITVNFTDGYGIQHTDAVFEVDYGYKNVSQIETIGSGEQNQQTTVINCQFKYWHSAAAKAAGCQPMRLISKEGISVFDAYPADPNLIVGLDAYCIDILKNNILPSIDPNATVIV